MSCNSVQTMLREALWAGDETRLASLEKHLAACEVCRAAMEQERNLLVRMDAELRAMVSVPVPASLPARVRVGFEAPWPRSIWVPKYALASVGLLLVALVGFRVAENRVLDSKLPVPQAQRDRAGSFVQSAPPEPANLLAGRAAEPRPATPVKSAGQPPLRKRAVSLRQPVHPEVLVGAEEARGFQQLTRTVEQKPELGRELIATAAPPAEVFVAPLAISEVRVAPLGEENR